MLQLLKNYLWHLPKAIIANVIYGFPARKLSLIGVTGTKGKTTTSHLIYYLLKESGFKVGLISTIGAFLSGKEIDTGLHITSPDPNELHKLLKLAVDSGIKYVVLEVTSNGLDQFRVWGIKFKVAVITNIYPDHLDYHGTMEKYVAAKAKIIRQAETVVVAKDSPYFEETKNKEQKIKNRIVAFESRGSMVSANRAAAVAAVEVLEIKSFKELKKLKLLKMLENFSGVPGRMETVYDKEFKVVIDFAHTPESLAAALGELRKLVKKNGRLIAVLGCAGERDHGRRRMGEVAAKMADFFVITAEDPRTENVEEISKEIAGYAIQAGAVEGKNFIRISDRQEAINFAIANAKSGDAIGLFGKGHEKSMCYGKTERPWSEHEAVQKALKICAESLDI
ncbi:hypothetical protein HYU89_03620 [Candidatus Collierbacteria bacterium]|nr:hypothetical protein [Candidatus Collierbacteria bacterium]